MNTIKSNDTSYEVITLDEFQAFYAKVNEVINEEHEQGVHRYSSQGFPYYAKEYFGVNEVLIATTIGTETSRVTQALSRMQTRATDAGCSVEMHNLYRSTLELIDEVARDLGLNPKASFGMKPFDIEYRAWLVSNAFGKPNSYVDIEESVPYLASQIFEAVEGMTRQEAVRYVSKNFGLYQF